MESLLRAHNAYGDSVIFYARVKDNIPEMISRHPHFPQDQTDTKIRKPTKYLRNYATRPLRKYEAVLIMFYTGYDITLRDLSVYRRSFGPDDMYTCFHIFPARSCE